METIAAIIRHTPVWVFGILVVLIGTGVQALRARTVSLWRLLLVPAIFVVWGVAGIVQRSAIDSSFALDWLGALAIGAAIGSFATRLRGVSYDRARRIVSIPGSPIPLIRNASIFVARYGLAVATAFATIPSERAILITLDVAVAGLMTGYFLGWLGRFTRIMLRHDQTMELTGKG